MISDDEDDFLGASESPGHDEEGSVGGGGSTSGHKATNHDSSPPAASVSASIRDHLPKQASCARVVTEALLLLPSSSIHVCPVVLSRERVTPPSSSPPVPGITSR